MIIINNLCVKNIVFNVDLKLHASINYIMGGNGAGKSTLLDCICGLKQNYTGSISGNKSIICLNQNLYFSNRLSLKDFVQFVYTLDNIQSPESFFWNQIPDDNMRGIWEKLWRKPIGTLSGGERALVFFIVISSLEREWYAFDEPFAGIDDRGKSYMVDAILRLHAKRKGIILTSHEKQPLEGFPSYTQIGLEKGRITGSIDISAERKNPDSE